MLDGLLLGYSIGERTTDLVLEPSENVIAIDTRDRESGRASVFTQQVEFLSSDYLLVLEVLDRFGRFHVEAERLGKALNIFARALMYVVDRQQVGREQGVTQRRGDSVQIIFELSKEIFG